MTDAAPPPVDPTMLVARQPAGAKPVRPRDAASLVLVRRDGDQLSVLMGRRHRKHRFMPDVFVFPGGRLDAADRQLRLPGPDFAGAGGGNPATLRALALAAVRETFEETGLLIGRPDPAAPATTSPGWQAFFATGHLPALDRLSYVYRAITPPMAVMRFHARFFLADAAHASGTIGGSGELEELAWYPQATALGFPLADITEKLLRDLPQLIAAPRLPVPLFRYVRGRMVAVSGTRRGAAVGSAR